MKIIEVMIFGIMSSKKHREREKTITINTFESNNRPNHANGKPVLADAAHPVKHTGGRSLTFFYASFIDWDLFITIFAQRLCFEPVVCVVSV